MTRGFGIFRTDMTISGTGCNNMVCTEYSWYIMGIGVGGLHSAFQVLYTLLVISLRVKQWQSTKNKNHVLEIEYL